MMTLAADTSGTCIFPFASLFSLLSKCTSLQDPCYRAAIIENTVLDYSFLHMFACNAALKKCANAELLHALPEGAAVWPAGYLGTELLCTHTSTSLSTHAIVPAYSRKSSAVVCRTRLIYLNILRCCVNVSSHFLPALHKLTIMSSPFTSRYDKLVEHSSKQWHIPGIAIAVVHGSDTWTKGYGLAQQDPPKPVEPSTLFYVASTTKAQLCAAWEIYIRSEANQSKPESERITWSTPLATIIRDDFVLCDPIRTIQITLEDAVSHRTGIPRHEASYGYEGVKTPKELTRNLRNLYLHNELRTNFEYCNTPFVAASHALETLTGKPLCTGHARVSVAAAGYGPYIRRLRRSIRGRE